jgi:uncharacterized protein DUF6193
VNERDLYPEAVDVGLSAALQVELETLGIDLEASWFEPLALRSGVERGTRRAQVSAAAEKRAFGLSLWTDGVGSLNGWSSELRAIAAAISGWLSDEQPRVDAMAARFSFLEVEPLGRAYERGEAIEYVWRGLLESPPVDAMLPLIERAADQPRLRRLRPWTSLDRVCFSRWVGWPFSNDLPYAAPRDGRFRVWRATDKDYLSEEQLTVVGEGDANRAVELLVSALPEPLEIAYRRPND